MTLRVISGDVVEVTDIVFDLESLSNRYDAAILSIGAVAFNRHTGQMAHGLELFVNIDDAIKHGHVNGSTIIWWMMQGDDSRDLFRLSEEKRVALDSAMFSVSKFVQSYPDAAVWGNGPIFDISAMEHAFAQCGMNAPWLFNKIRDMRTLMDIAYDMTGFDKRKDVIQGGTPHDAFEDALWAKNAIVAAFKAIREATRPATPVEDSTE